MLYRVDREDFRWVVWLDGWPAAWVAWFQSEGSAREYAWWLNMGKPVPVEGRREDLTEREFNILSRMGGS